MGAGARTVSAGGQISELIGTGKNQDKTTNKHEIGCTPYPASGLLPTLILFSDGASNNVSELIPQGDGRTLPGGKRCNHPLDPLGRHAGLWNTGLYTRRHD